jgi:GT2 family glycosyltransferase
MNQPSGGAVNTQRPLLANLSVVVLSHNRREELRRNLQSLCELQDAVSFELIVVDNASTDGTQEDLSELQKRHRGLAVVFAHENLGVARGRNLGWARATRPYILNLDDDTHIELEDMSALLQAAAGSDSIGIVTPGIVDAATGALQNGCYAGRVREPANFAGACHLVRREVWERVGELDPGCSFGGEEIDYSIRARAAGYSTVCLAEATARHHGTTRSNSAGRRRREQWVYNYTRVFFKHFPLRHALVFAGRGLVSHLVYGIAAHGPTVAVPLIYNSVRGAVDGRKCYVLLPEPALRFYTDPALLPDIGQVPLWRKLVARLTRSGRGGAPVRDSA